MKQLHHWKVEKDGKFIKVFSNGVQWLDSRWSSIFLEYKEARHYALIHSGSVVPVFVEK